jgi:general secretion pathway protein J
MRRSNSGFTLLEVLIAMAIFAILGLASNQMLRSVSGIEREMSQQTHAYRELIKLFGIIDRDLSQLIYRGVRDEFGDPIAAVSVNQERYPLEFSRSGWRNPLERARSDLQRVAYEVNGDKLQRVIWLVLDRAEDTEPKIQTLLSDVIDFKVQVIKPDGQRQELITAEDGDEVPVALEVKVTTERWGELARVIDLPDYLPLLPGGAPGDEGELEIPEPGPEKVSEPAPLSLTAAQEAFTGAP